MSSKAQLAHRPHYSQAIQLMKSIGYEECVPIADTLQGSIWKCLHTATHKRVVIKMTDMFLSKNKIGFAGDQKITIHEDIKKETAILKQLSEDKHCPKSIIKYEASFQSDNHYLLVMEHGGWDLLKFAAKAHQFIVSGHLEISEWHRIVRIIFKQMLEAIEYIHSKNVCHFDISLENFLINDVGIRVKNNNKLSFFTDGEDSVQIKLCDFGLAEFMPKNGDGQSQKYCGKRNYMSPELSAQKSFSAKSNDVWCLGPSLFMLIFGTSPWKRAVRSDMRFECIMNGNILSLLSQWNKLHFLDSYILDVFSSLFRYEENRITIASLKQSQWLSCPL
eukprot:219825_1